MKKWITPLLLLLTVLLLTGLAFLPTVAGLLQDAQSNNAPSSSPLHSITPFPSDKDPDLTVAQKLTILLDCETNTIVPALASMTEGEVQATVLEHLQPYIEAEVFSLWNHIKFFCHPMIAISVQDPSHYLLYWSVSISGVSDDNGKQAISMVVDDETGMLLTIDFYADTHAEPTNIKNRLENYARIWLEQAGQTDAQPIPQTNMGTTIHIDGVQKIGYQLEANKSTPLYIYFCPTDGTSFYMWFTNMPE